MKTADKKDLAIKQCGSCEQTFTKLKDRTCPHCGSSNWVNGFIDESTDLATARLHKYYFKFKYDDNEGKRVINL